MSVGSLRKELRNHIQGDGIEIGALHNPFDLSGLPVTRVRYVDRMPIEQLRLQYPELNNVTFVDVDIIDDGQILATIPDESLDFVIANHLIEHCDNTLGTLETWLSKLGCGGIIFMAVPDQRRGWDERREVTSLAHILQDYRCTPVERKARNYEHFKEWTQLVGNIFDEAHVRWLIEKDASIHFHVFTFESFRVLLDYASREMRLPFRVVDAAEPADCSWESVFSGTAENT